jgi:hypothetical protein
LLSRDASVIAVPARGSLQCAHRAVHAEEIGRRRRQRLLREASGQSAARRPPKSYFEGDMNPIVDVPPINGTRFRWR